MKFFGIALMAAAVAQPVFACDICALYAAHEASGEIGKGAYLGAAEQFTHFGTLQEDGTEVANPEGQKLDSSITQVLAGYNFSERWGLQFTAPLVHRSFRRVEAGLIETGTESGLGDVSLTAHWQVWRRDRHESTFAWTVLGGVKLPTGDTDRLAEELNETPPPPGSPESGVHGHDLTLGSGSWDGVIGTSVYARWRRLFLTAALQYAIRTEGDYHYQFANDLTWSGGPGYLLNLGDDFSLSLQANVSGETKHRDEFEGQPAEDTGITAVYLGPELILTWREKLSAEFGADFPVSIDNTALQIVPDWRLRGAITWHF